MRSPLLFVIIFSGLILFVSCSNHESLSAVESIMYENHDIAGAANAVNFYSPAVDDEYISMFSIATPELIAILANQLISDQYDFDIDISMLVMDIYNNEFILSYGDVYSEFYAGLTFWPILSAVLINEYDIHIHDEFENMPFITDLGEKIVAHRLIDNEAEAYHQGMISFMQAVHDANTAVIFRIVYERTMNTLFENLQRFNWTALMYDVTEQATEQVWQTMGHLKANPVELALAYASLINDGKFYDSIYASEYTKVFESETTIQVMDILKNHLIEQNNTWGFISEAQQNKILWDDFIDNTIGVVSLIHSDDDTSSAWFISIYPYAQPRYISVLNLSYATEEINRIFMNVAEGYSARIPNVDELINIIYTLYELMYMEESEPDTLVTADFLSPAAVHHGKTAAK